MIDTFSSNSLKILEKNIVEFQNKYIFGLSLYKKDKRTALGQKFHSLIYYYIKGFDIKKLLLDLEDSELEFWKKLEKKLEAIKNDFIKTEYSFLIKDILNNKPYYLTGRFDAIYKKNDEIIIYDWKTLNIPYDASYNLQTTVYLYCANKIFKSENIKIRYLSIEKLFEKDVVYENTKLYKNKIENIIKRLPEYS